MLTSDQVAQELGVCQRTVYRLCRAGRIEHTRLGTEYRFKAEWVEAFINRKKRVPLVTTVRRGLC